MSDTEARSWLVTELAPDGSSARSATLLEAEAGAGDGGLELGRSAQGLAYPDDDQMADRQARLVCSGTHVALEDLGEGSGVWLRIVGSEGRALADGDQVWLGAQILVFRGFGTSWVIRHHGPDGRLRDSHPVPPQGFFLGRGSELVLDPDDAQLSRRHAQVAFVDGELRYFDRGAQNGSFVRLRAAENVGHRAEFRIATRRFRLEACPIEPEACPIESEAVGPAGVVAPEEPVEESTLPMEPSLEEAAEAAHPAPFEEATVLNLPAEDEPVAAEPAAPPSPESEQSREHALEPPPSRRGPGLGARLRRLGRQLSDSEASAAPEAVPEFAERTVAVPLADDPDPESAPDAEPMSPGANAASSPAPEQSDTALESDRVLLVLDSQQGSVSIEVEPGRTVLEAVQQAGLERGQPIDWECGDGGCGVCIVGVVEGADRMDPPDPGSGEMRTIQITEQVAPDPTKYRLACLARVRGTVRLRKLT